MSIHARRAPRTGAGRASGRIRVLWLIKGLGRGGAELLLLHAAALRDREAFDYEAAYLLPHKAALAGELRASGVPVHLLDAPKAADISWARRLRELLRDRPFDVVHVHSPYVAGVARLVVRSLPRSVRPCTISTEHVPWSGYAFPTRLLNALTFGLDATHLAVSDAVRSSIPRPFRRNVQTLIHGIPLDLTVGRVGSRAAMRAELGVAPDEVLIGTVANFRAQKGYPNLLAAARLVLDRVPRARFAVVGQGPLEDDIRQMHRSLGFGDRFLMLGGREDAASFIAACDVFALASLYEGLPLAVMEALALGVPVVATSVDGVIELVNDGIDGILVPPSDPDAMARALVEVASNPERRKRLGRAASEGALRFDNRAAVKAIESLYQRMVRPDRDESGDGIGPRRRDGATNASA